MKRSERIYRWLLASFYRLQHVNLGFHVDDVLTFEVNLPSARYDAARRAAFHEELAERLRTIPGVTAAGAISFLPATGNLHGWNTSILSGPKAGTQVTKRDGFNIQQRTVSGDVFAALRIPLLAGRTFDRSSPRSCRRSAFSRRCEPSSPPRIRSWRSTRPCHWQRFSDVEPDESDSRLSCSGPSLAYGSIYRVECGSVRMRGALHVSAHQDTAGPNPPEATDRANWPVDIDAEIDCWRGQRRVRMLGCRWEGDYLVCETRVSTGPVEPVRGLICVRRDALEILPNDRQRRIAVLERKFGRYICRLRPRSRFVFELRRLWPLRLTVNWPF